MRDVLDAANYVAEESGSPALGDRIVDQLLGVMEKLAEFEEMGRPRSEIRANLRSFVSPPYIIFYRRMRDGVYIVRVLHERQDIEKAFPKRRPR